MRAVWHLAISSLAGRWGRTGLLVLAVALATVLTVAIAAAVGTLEKSIGMVVGRVAGLADLTVHHRYNSRLQDSVLEQLRQWPEVALATGRLESGITLKLARTGRTKTVMVQGVEPELDQQVNPRQIVDGRAVEAPGETMLDSRVARRLGARVDDVLDVIRFGDPVQLKVVGVFQRAELDILQRPMAVVSLADAQMLSGYEHAVDEIDIQVRSGVDADALAARRGGELPKEAAFRTPASARAGVNRGLAAAHLMLLIVTVLVSLSAGFIILTSLTTSVTQRMRELAILRCVGTSRFQIAAAQVLAGGLVALLGAAAGAPMGVLGAYWLYLRHHRALPGGFTVSPSGVALAVGGSVLAGLVGALYPAMLAASNQPMQVMTVRARSTKRWQIVACLVAGAALAGVQPVLMALPIDSQAVFWFYIYVGLPLTFVGYFLLSVPILMVLAHVAAPVVGRLLRVPGDLLRQSVLATPLRHGFTGGALMVGLAMLVTIWTEGGNVLHGWFENLVMPDAFVHGFNTLSPQQYEAIKAVKGVTLTCPVVMFPVSAVNMQFGVKNISPPFTWYVSTDTDAFFAMADLTWVQGDEESARKKLAKGRAVLVSREYLTAHGLGVGGTITLQTLRDGPVPFEVAGVISSPGLDVAVSFFGIERSYTDAALSCVFGTRKDATDYFGVADVKMVLLSLDPGVDDRDVIDNLKAAVPGSVAGSSRVIRHIVSDAFQQMIKVASTIAVVSLLIACFGVANLIIAEVSARRFEYGVLRAIGGPRVMLGRMVGGQTVIIGLVGCLTGTLLGIQLGLVAQGFHERLAGLDYTMHLPWRVIAWGCAAVMTAALVAAAPAMWRLMRQQPRDLLASQG